MTGHKKRQKGGWPKRELVSFMLRIDPDIAKMATKAAESVGLSRNDLISDWMGVLVMLLRLGKGELLLELADKLEVVENSPKFSGKSSDIGFVLGVLNEVEEISLGRVLVRGRAAARKLKGV